MNRLPRADLRRLRAQHVTAAIMHVIAKHVGDDTSMHDLHDELFRLLHEQGAEIISDHDRQAAGLPSRGPDGWTAEEMIALEEKRLELLRQPLVSPIIRCE